MYASAPKTRYPTVSTRETVLCKMKIHTMAQVSYLASEVSDY